MHRIENRKLSAKIVDMMTYTGEQQGAILRMYGVSGGINPILYTTESGVKQQLDKYEPGEIGELKVLTFVGGHPKMRKFTFRMKKKQDPTPTEILDKEIIRDVLDLSKAITG